MYDDVLEEPKPDKQLLKDSPDHQMFTLPSLHQLLLQTLQTTITQLKQLPTTCHSTELKKFPSTSPTRDPN